MHFFFIYLSCNSTWNYSLRASLASCRFASSQPFSSFERCCRRRKKSSSYCVDRLSLFVFVFHSFSRSQLRSTIENVSNRKPFGFASCTKGPNVSIIRPTDVQLVIYSFRWFLSHSIIIFFFCFSFFFRSLIVGSMERSTD